MRMRCYKCGHSWNYRGKYTEGEGYITCPGCYYKIRVDKALIEAPSKQELLTNLPNKGGLPSELPIKLPTTGLKIEFETIRDQDGFVYLVDKRIAKQFKEAQEGMGVPNGGANLFQEQESDIKILPPKFEIIRIIPRAPIKILEHQQEYGLRITN